MTEWPALEVLGAVAGQVDLGQVGDIDADRLITPRTSLAALPENLPAWSAD